MLRCLHDSTDFDETWVKRSLPRGPFGVLRIFWSKVILGSFGVTVEGSNFKQPSTTKLCQCVGLGQPSKNFHGDLFVWPVVKGSKVRKVQIRFYAGWNIELLNNIRKLTLPMCWSWSTIIKSSLLPSFDLWLRGQRSWKFKFCSMRGQISNKLICKN